MITGFNTDIEYEGRTYHVQTEDKGAGNPTVESLVYTGGEILTSRRSSYAERAAMEDFGEQTLLKLMEDQHQTLIREIRNGLFDPDGPKPFGYNIISNRSLDEVVSDFLSTQLGVERIRLEVEERVALVEGGPAAVRLRVLADDGSASGAADAAAADATEAEPVAIPGATVTAKLISTCDRPVVLFQGETDSDGRVVAEFEVPLLPEADAAVLIQADAAGRNAETKQFVRKRTADAASDDGEGAPG